MNKIPRNQLSQGSEWPSHWKPWNSDKVTWRWFKKWKDTHVLELKEWGMLKWSCYPMQSTYLIRSLSKRPWHFSQKSWSIGKYPDAGKDWGQEEKRGTEDEMVGWHHRFNRHESEQTPVDGEEQGSLECCSRYGHRAEYNLTTEQ